MSVNTQALLVSLNFTLPRQSIKLVKQAQEVEDKANAKRGTVKATLAYFQRQEGAKSIDALAEVKSFQNEWRSEHNKLTKPWDNNNTRLLPAPLIDKYMAMTEKMKAEYPKIIEKFLDVYPEWAASAPERMGDLYSISKFPSASEVTGAISHTVYYVPLPSAAQVKAIAAISSDVAKTIEQSTNEQVSSAVEAARKDTWVQIIKPILHLTNELNRPDKKKVHKTLITNITDIIDLTATFGETFGDKNLIDIANIAKEKLKDIDPEDLKNPEIQKLAIEKSKEILEEFNPFYRDINMD